MIVIQDQGDLVMTEMESWIKENSIGEDDTPYGGGLFWFGQDLTIAGLGRMMKMIESGGSYRDQATSRFSFGILTQAVVDAIRKYGPILEVGSGTGYWAWELRKQGVDVIATDPAPYSCVVTEPKMWLHPEPLDAVAAVRRYGEGRSLLMVWPSLGEDWAARCLEEYRTVGGQTLIHVGEYGGCTADERFFEVLARDWEEVENVPLLRWEMIRDYCDVFRRRSTGQGRDDPPAA